MSKDKEKWEAAVRHLLSNIEFVNDLKAYYEYEDSDLEWQEVLTAIQDIENGNVCLLSVVEDYFNQALHDIGNEIESYYWDSPNWGPGGNGYLKYIEAYGVVGVSSSDFPNDHMEIYDEETFVPWIETGDEE